MRKFVEKHTAFILTMLVTYILGLLLCVAQYLANDGAENMFKVLINSIVPTTITYVLGCVLVNIVEVLKEKTENYLYNIFTLPFIFMYAIIFCMYLLSEFTIVWGIIECIVTLILLMANIFCYKEKFEHRNHGIA